LKVGDLVRIKRGQCKGRLILVIKVGKRFPKIVHCFHHWNPSQDEFGYYTTDLEVINESR